MHENAKLEEARYFLSQMLNEVDHREHFTNNLSAFLSAARSVLQYAKKEAEKKPGGQKWYEGHISNSRVLPFFRDKRDINIHREPVKTLQHTDIKVTDTIHVSCSVSIVHKDAQGNILNQSPPEEPKPQKKAAEIPPEIKITYKFSDWAGPEDVITLSKICLDELKSIVQDGENKSFIT